MNKNFDTARLDYERELGLCEILAEEGAKLEEEAGLDVLSGLILNRLASQNKRILKEIEQLKMEVNSLRSAQVSLANGLIPCC